MRLKLSTPKKSVYQGEIKKISFPTENGTITITDANAPLATALKPGIVSIIPFEGSKPSGYVFSKNEILISINKGMAFVDGKIIRIVTESATTLPNESGESLKKKKEALEKEIQQLKAKGSIEQIEDKMINLKKVDADIKLGNHA